MLIGDKILFVYDFSMNLYCYPHIFVCGLCCDEDMYEYGVNTRTCTSDIYNPVSVLSELNTSKLD
jgi:hypothetical protein